MAAVTARSSTRTTTITTTPNLVAVDVRPVLFNIGVNEMQTVANATGSTKMQTDINRTGLKKMQLYLEDFEKFQERFDSSASASGAGGAGGVAVSSGAGSFVVPWRDEALKCRGLLSTIGAMIDAEESASAGTKSKNVDLLLASSFAARILNGARTTSCKSAKDRTSMFHTLEAVRLAQQKELRSGKEIGRVGSLQQATSSRNPRKGSGSGSGSGGGGGSSSSNAAGLALPGAFAPRPRPLLDCSDAAQEQAVLDPLRGPTGVRLQNAGDNIGKMAFSFNQLQVKALPLELQPPLSSIGGAKNS